MMDFNSFFIGMNLGLAVSNLALGLWPLVALNALAAILCWASAAFGPKS